MSPEQRMRLHAGAAVLWLVLAIATTGWAIWDSDSKFLLAWVIFMSAYANTASHWSAREGAAPSAGDDAVIQELGPRALEQIVVAVAQGRARG